MSFYQIKDNHITLNIYAKPNAKKTAIVGINAHGLNIALKAKPIDGQANQELIAYLSTAFKVPKSKVKLVKGLSGRMKIIQMPINDNIKAFIRSKEDF